MGWKSWETLEGTNSRLSRCKGDLSELRLLLHANAPGPWKVAPRSREIIEENQFTCRFIPPLPESTTSLLHFAHLCISSLQLKELGPFDSNFVLSMHEFPWIRLNLHENHEKDWNSSMLSWFSPRRFALFEPGWLVCSNSKGGRKHFDLARTYRGSRTKPDAGERVTSGGCIETGSEGLARGVNFEID